MFRGSVSCGNPIVLQIPKTKSSSRFVFFLRFGYYTIFAELENLLPNIGKLDSDWLTSLTSWHRAMVGIISIKLLVHTHSQPGYGSLNLVRLSDGQDKQTSCPWWNMFNHHVQRSEMCFDYELTQRHVPSEDVGTGNDDVREAIRWEMRQASDRTGVVFGYRQRYVGTWKEDGSGVRDKIGSQHVLP